VLATSSRHPFLLVVLWRCLMNVENAVMRHGVFGCMARLLSIKRCRSLPGPKPTTSRPLPWLKNSACVPSRRIATVALAPCIRQTGQRVQARAELSTAIEIYCDMAMTFWLPETEAALAETEAKA
jgi:hypothetical protein